MPAYVYSLLNDNDEVIFVGTTTDGTQAKLTKKFETKWWGYQVDGVDIDGPMTQGQASYLKEKRMARHRPRFNKAYANMPENQKYKPTPKPFGHPKRKKKNYIEL